MSTIDISSVIHRRSSHMHCFWGTQTGQKLYKLRTTLEQGVRLEQWLKQNKQISTLYDKYRSKTLIVGWSCTYLWHKEVWQLWHHQSTGRWHSDIWQLSPIPDASILCSASRRADWHRSSSFSTSVSNIICSSTSSWIPILVTLMRQPDCVILWPSCDVW